MSGTRTAVAVLAATVVAGGALVAAQQPAARSMQTAQPAARPPAAPAAQPARGTAPAPPTQTTGQLPSQGLPLTPTIREHGSSVTPAFEGWFHGKDGSDYVMAGYFNRNIKDEFDVPVGPNNHVDPGGPDQGQPTHFYLGRQWGVFTIKLPKDFGTKKLVWTLVVNGFTNQITLHTPPVYIVEPYGSSWNDNKPPVLRLDPSMPTFTGPPIGTIASYTTTVGAPLPLTAWITDDGTSRTGGAAPAGGAPAGGAAPGGRAGRAGGAAPDAAPAGADAAAPTDGAPAAPAAGGGGGGRGGRGRGAAAPAAGAAGAAAPAGGGFGGRGIGVTWAMHRNPAAGGTVKFGNAKPAVDAANGGKTETTATFSAPGDYIIRVQGNDSSGDGGGGEQCCWTNGLVKVTVK